MFLPFLTFFPPLQSTMASSTSAMMESMDGDDGWCSAASEFKALLTESADGFGFSQSVLNDLSVEEIIAGNSYESLWWFLSVDWANLDRTAVVAAKLSDNRAFIKNLFRYTTKPLLVTCYFFKFA